MTHDPRFLPVAQPGRLPEAPPVFERIAIVGLGLIGGSIALGARQVWPKSLVIGVDRNDVLELAMRLHAVDVAAEDLSILSDVELVVLAAPVQENCALLLRLPDFLRGPAMVTDVGSTKRDIVKVARQLPSSLTFVPGHPLAGAARAGIAHARADLFVGRPWILTPAAAQDDEVSRLSAFVSALGASPVCVDPDAHDRLVAYLSHVPQLVASTLMAAVGAGAGVEGLALAGRGLIDTTRLAASPSGIWTDICSANADEIGPALDQVIARLTELRRHLGSGDAVQALFAQANLWRERLVGAGPNRHS